MLLSKLQKSLIDILKSYGAVRVDQAIQLLRLEHEKQQWEFTVHQLECGGMVLRDHGYVRLPDRAPDQRILEAVDIMLLLDFPQIQVHEKGTPPFALTFFKVHDQKLWRYDICPVPPGKESVICAQLEGINIKYRLIIFLLETPEQEEQLFIPCDHCFTWKDNGSYRFYK